MKLSKKGISFLKSNKTYFILFIIIAGLVIFMNYRVTEGMSKKQKAAANAQAQAAAQAQARAAQAQAMAAQLAKIRAA